MKDKKILTALKCVLPHACIIMSGMLLLFFWIDRVNSHVAFLTNEFHKWLLLALSILCIAESVMLIADNRNCARRAIQRARAKKKGKVK